MIQYTVGRGIWVLMFFLLVFPTGIHAQNSTSSPFSMFGLGEIETRDFSRATGMGNVGIGIRDRNFLNRRNPAGLSGIDTLVFILDVSAAVKLSEFRTKTQKENTTNFNFKNLAAGVRPTKWWTSSVGLGPYSNVGYDENVLQSVAGTIASETAITNFSGSGGINKFYWANAFEVFRGLSLGVTSSFLFGNTSHTETLYAGNTAMMSRENTSNVSKIYFDFGIQYARWFGKFTRVVAGGVYGYESNMDISRQETVTSSGYIAKDQPNPDTRIYIPESYGAGFSILRNKGNAEWVLAADYQYQNWSVNHTKHKSLQYTDSHIYSAGLQVTPNTKRPEKYIQAMRFHIGACYNQSYLTVNGYQLNDCSVSFGAAFPFRNRSYVNVAVNLGESGTGKRGGITERYALLSVNLSLIEIWFEKFKWD